MNLKSNIPFNKPFQTGKELEYIQDAINRGKISGNGHYTHLCQEFFEQRYGIQKCLLTNSCTDALEMAAILCDIQAGDEVIIPSFTFVSSANAFVLRGAKVVFVDSHSDHPNMDERLIEELITPKTKAIVVVHYGGEACEMDTIMEIANRHNLFVIEDAAQAINSFYKGKALGSIGHLGCMSFHETKNIQCGEGGMLMINDPQFIKRAEILWEKGTDRAAFFRGEVNKYGWVDIGSSFLPSELNAAYLWAQLENLDKIQERRKAIWEDYFRFFKGDSSNLKSLSLQFLKAISNDELRMMNEYPPNSSFHISHSSFMANAHLFYLLFPSQATRTAYSEALKEQGILAVFHYQSLHKSEFSKMHFPNQYKRSLPNSDRFSNCLLRLPLFYELPAISQR
ncbi:dTDP-4-amino-4,6-dideoxygalactose transaminase [Algoriphagus sp. YJ13C]|uniref:dTDP-4-amino-4,6-dideoxygalactose transaminase n=1 Tax=Algoriphagus pacificus TaxID=2811234 RepID=A0ABS3CL87_9BACT|nr:dTDP-4-amino-4,6-dideoxygalactose transaminase [Algoriphagus pacificus]